jgi:hypothetical protein
MYRIKHLLRSDKHTCSQMFSNINLFIMVGDIYQSVGLKLEALLKFPCTCAENKEVLMTLRKLFIP